MGIRDRPIAAFLIAGLGGIFQLGAGLLILIAAGIGAAIAEKAGQADAVSRYLGPVALPCLLLAVITGPTTAILAEQLNKKSSQHEAVGFFLIIFSALGFVAPILFLIQGLDFAWTFGVALGPLFGILGGVLAYLWKPSVAASQNKMSAK